MHELLGILHTSLSTETNTDALSDPYRSLQIPDWQRVLKLMTIKKTQRLSPSHPKISTPPILQAQS